VDFLLTIIRILYKLAELDISEFKGMSILDWDVLVKWIVIFNAEEVKYTKLLGSR
jgi:hypothetical protein